MKETDGYPGQELRRGVHYHENALMLNSTRCCLVYILIARKYKKVYIPYYTSEDVLGSFSKSACGDYEFYNIDKNFYPVNLPELKDNEAFLYTNYFGLMQDNVEKLAALYGTRLIVDNSLAFFDLPHKGIDTLYDARKFFDVPDGAYLYTDAISDECNGSVIEADCPSDRISTLLRRIDPGAETGYADLIKPENQLSRQSVKEMSKPTESILGSINYQEIKSIRRTNFTYFHIALGGMNFFDEQSLDLDKDAVPMIYPLLSEDERLREKLISENIIFPAYRLNVIDSAPDSSWEHNLAKHLIPLPIDQPYTVEGMGRIIEEIISR